MRARVRVLIFAFVTTAPAPLAFTGEDIVFRWDGFKTADGVDMATKSKYRSGHLSDLYGADILLDAYDGEIVPPSSGSRYAEWHAEGVAPGAYCVSVSYATSQSRPLSLSINGNVVLHQKLGETTGGGKPEDRKTLLMGGPVKISETEIRVRLTANAVPNESWPHFHEMRFSRSEAGSCP
jgi:hypothetical protein